MEPLSLQLIEVPTTTDGSCGQGAGAGSLTRELPRNRYTLRFTFVRRPDGNVGEGAMRKREIVCHRIVEPNEQLQLMLPLAAGHELGIYVEAFGNGGNLLLAGFTERMDTQSKVARVLLHAVSAQSCGYRARGSRAFHTATLLPNGQVLMLGGLMGSSSGSVKFGGELFANGSVGIFDPQDHRWRLATAKEPKLARAFHQAVLLPSKPAGPYRILIFGGLMASSAADTRVARRNDSNLGGGTTFPCADGSPCRYHFPFVPHEKAIAGESGIVIFDPITESVQYEPFPALPPSLFPAAATNPNGTLLLVSDGAQTYDTAAAGTQGFMSAKREAHWLDLTTTPPTVSAVSAPNLRAGHAVAPIDASSFVILGGNMEGDDLAIAAAFGARAESNANISAVAANGIEPTAWHTLTPVGGADWEYLGGNAATSLLYAGGYLLRSRTGLSYSSALPSSTARRLHVAEQLRVVGSNLEVAGSAPTHSLRNIGYHQATRLADGSVLVTGGAFQGKCTLDSLFCPASEVARFQRSADGTIVGNSDAVPPTLIKGRYGHRATRLLDNTVLISGGLGIDGGGSPEVVVDAERISVLSGDMRRLPLWLERNGSPLLPGALANNNVATGACLSDSEAGQISSASMKIVTGPLSRAKRSLRSR